MRMREVVDIIETHKRAVQRDGYLVSAEHVESGMLRGVYFPDKDEVPIATEEEAWRLAREFAAATHGEYVNIYVVHANGFAPVMGYESRKILNR